MSLGAALEELLGGPCFHGRRLPGYPYALGRAWTRVLAGGTPTLRKLLAGYAGAVDWPAALFWRELSAANPDALVVLSRRDSADTWLESMEETVLPVARAVAPESWTGAKDIVVMTERFAGTRRWDDPAVLRAAYDGWLASVRSGVPADRLLEWQPEQGWGPLCAALGLPVPDHPFPWVNRREDWPY
jgi:hypothetical protein